MDQKESKKKAKIDPFQQTCQITLERVSSTGSHDYYIMLSYGKERRTIMRNIKKQKEQANKIIKNHPNIDLTAGELMELRESFMKTAEKHGMSEAILDLAIDAFLMGLAVGYRNGKKDSRK